MGILDIFEKFRDTIVLKEDCDLERKVKYLENLKKKYPNNKDLNQQLFVAQKGLEGENEILYQLKKSNIGMFVLHDVNIEYEDLKAQIDFIIVTPWCCYFIECKNLLGNITVNEKGDFIREYKFKGHSVKKGMESPYRQVQAQRDVYKKIWFKLQGKLKSFLFEKSFDDLHRILVVAANGENILNTKSAPKEMRNNVIKADALIRKLEYDRDHSEKDLWDNKKQMEEWANHFLHLNVNKENREKIIEENVAKEEQHFFENVESVKADEKNIRESLLEFRKKRSIERKIPAYYIFNNEELDKILEHMPKTFEELKKLKILTEVKANSHGKDIVNIINNK